MNELAARGTAATPMTRSSRRRATARSWPLPRLLICGFGAAAVGPIAAAHGGYFPTAWGWQSLLLIAVATVAIVVRAEIRVSALELVALAAGGALLAWILLSALWAPSPTQPMLEGERTLVYVGGLLAMLLIVRRASYRMLLGGVWSATTTVCCFSLATRLFPGWYSTFDSFAAYRLSEPIGYWNGLGIFAAMGVLLALALAARARVTALRALGAASVPLLTTTLYFTYSRGAWIALMLGLATALALDCRRLQLVTSSVLVAGSGGVAVALASGSAALTHLQASRAEAAHEGHRLAVALLVVAAASGVSALAAVLAERRLVVHRRTRTVYAAVLLLVLVTGVATAFVRYGGPLQLARRGYHSLDATVPRSANLNKRLFTLSSPGRVDHWRVARKQYEAHPLLGSGAGTFEQHWMRDRRLAGNVRNAHNLYLETLATLGPVGLALLLVLVASPLVAAVRARRSSFVPLATGAYAAFVAHAAIDWDWQLPAVTLAALACGAGVLVAARSEIGPRRLGLALRVPLAAASLVLFAAAFVGLLGNLALARAGDAIAASDFKKAESDARKAHRWAPWSAQPWRRLGEAEVAAGDYAAARLSFRKALVKDPSDWFLWFDLGGASRGAARRAAIAEALRLNPLSPEIAETMPNLTRQLRKEASGASS
jgi:tetratricopeptide (TPR) repeat protein